MLSITLNNDAVFEDWQPFARYLLNRQIPPDQVIWQSEPTQDLFGCNSNTTPLTLEDIADQPASSETRIKVNRNFFQLARYAVCHQDSRRFNLLYHLLWRLAFEDNLLLANVTDPQVHQANQWAKAVGRDRHKMKAFVRFRKVTLKDVNPEETALKEHYIAWFEPDHYIVKLAADFFCERFTNMDWTIMTPYLCIHWLDKTLYSSPGGHWQNAPASDVLEDYWRTYYANIFNPARLKVKAMCAEMPKKYWHNLPEASLIKPLIEQSEKIKQSMINTAPTEPALPASTRFQREQWLEKKAQPKRTKEIQSTRSIPE